MANVSVMCVALGVAKLAHATNARLGGGRAPVTALSVHTCTHSTVTQSAHAAL